MLRGVATRRFVGLVTPPHNLVRTLAAGLCLAALPMTAAAQEETPGLVGLSLPLGARVIGQGRAVAGARGEIQALPYNPATLAVMGGSAVTYSRFEAADMADLNSNFLAAATETRHGTVAVHAVYIDYGSIPVTDASPEPIGSIEVSDWAVGVTLARQWRGKLAYGATAKWLNVDLGSVSAGGPAFDAGLVYEPKPSLPLSLAVSLRNMGPDLDFGGSGGDGDGTEALPGRVRVGVHYHPAAFPGLPPEYRVTVSFDIESVARELATSSQHAGASVLIHDVVAVRGGLVLMDNPFASRSASNRSAGGAVGVGVKLGELEADLAREMSVSELGDETHISILYRF